MKSNGASVSGLTKLTFDYDTCKLVIYSDGSGRVEYSTDIKPTPINRMCEIGYMGGAFQPGYADLGYGLQDDIIKPMANMEHTALHLWLGNAHSDETLRAPGSTRLTRANTITILKATHGIDEHILEETFVTNIQLLANGIQPDNDRNAELEVSCAWLALQPIAITSALAFVSYFRAEVRRHLAKRAN